MLGAPGKVIMEGVDASFRVEVGADALQRLRRIVGGEELKVCGARLLQQAISYQSF